MIDQIFDPHLSLIHLSTFPDSPQIIANLEENLKLKVLIGDLNSFGSDELFKYEHNSLLNKDLEFKESSLDAVLNFKKKSFKIYRMQDISMKIRYLVHFLGLRFQKHVNCNLYNSNYQDEVLGKHVDLTPILIIQVEGCKRWHFKDFFCDTSAGDIMFIPNGVEHRVETLSEKSIHLTVSIHEQKSYKEFIYTKNTFKYNQNPFEGKISLNTEKVNSITFCDKEWKIKTKYKEYTFKSEKFINDILSGVPIDLSNYMSDRDIFSKVKLLKSKDIIF